MTGATVAARIAGMDPVDTLMKEEIALLKEVAFAKARVDEPTAEKLSLWASVYARTSPIPPGDVDAFLSVTSRLNQVTRAWVDDPDSTIASLGDEVPQ